MNATPRKPSAKPSAPGFQPADFFVLRTPLLPFDELLALGEGLAAPSVADDPARLEAALASDRLLLRERLRAVVARPEVREALLVASPSLDESIPQWLAAPESERGQKVEHTVVRYLARMAGRPTPFGLFAGCSMGAVDAAGAETRLTVGALGAYGRHTRLDMDYLFSLTEALCRLPGLRPLLRVRPNSSLYRAGGRLRYAEARLDGKVRNYHLVAVEPTDYLEATLERASRGARPAELARALVDADPSIAPEEAAGYIDALLDSQILVADLAPAVTGPEPTLGIVDELRSIPQSAEAALAAQRLAETHRALEALDARAIGSSVEEPPYRALAKALGDLPAEAELARLFQVDMTKPSPRALLGGAVLDEIAGALRLCHRLAGPSDSTELKRFREQLTARWEGQEVPLVTALDEESGIGLGAQDSAEAAPLLAGLHFPPAAGGSATVGAGYDHLLRRLLADRGALELRLDESDLAKLEQRDPPPLPDSFAAMATIAAADAEALARGDFRVHLHFAGGPSGANLLGRFCHGLPALDAAVRRHLADEEALRADAIFAEIVHLPDGRVGNVLLRPVLRGHEIPFLGRSGAPDEQLIPVTDLLVSVVGERIVLRSRRLLREVIPRLTNAHNFSARSLGVYRFLCTLQSQGTASLVWRWGALESAAFLPRVVHGRVVLSKARWRLAESQCKPLGTKRGAALYRAVQALRAELGMPRHVALTDGDNVLPIDLDSALSVETFAQLVKGRVEATVSEMAPGPDELCARGPEGRFVHELVIPFLRVGKAAAGDGKTSVATSSSDGNGNGSGNGNGNGNENGNGNGSEGQRAAGGAFVRSFPPGSEWLYAKVYAGTATVDQVLAAVAPVVRGALDGGAADRWFFIRYGDPDWHLRLRLHGSPARLAAEVLPALHAAAAPLLTDGRVWKIQLDTYEREVERYGAEAGLAVCERLFHADSDAVLAIVGTLSGDEGADARWRLALLGCERLLDDLGLDFAARRALMRRLREGYGREQRVDVNLERQLGERYRKERPALEELLSSAAAANPEHPFAPGFAAFAARSAASAPAVAELRALEAAGRLAGALPELAGSLLHMHTNRLLRSAARAQELVIYDLLDRLYQSREARAKRG